MNVLSNEAVTSYKRTFVGCWLAFLYVICVSSVIYSLSSYQIQSKLNSIPEYSAENEDLFIDHKCDISNFNKIESSPSSQQLATLPCVPNKSSIKVSYYSFGNVLMAIDKNKFLNLKIKEARTYKQVRIDGLNFPIEKLSNGAQGLDEGINDTIKKTIKKGSTLNDGMNQKMSEIHKTEQALIDGINKEDRSALTSEEIALLKSAIKANKQKTSEDLRILNAATEANKQKVNEDLRILRIAAKTNKQKVNEDLRILKLAAEANKQKVNQELESLLQNKAVFMSENQALADVLSNIEYFEIFFNWVSDLLGTPPFWALPESILIQLLVLSTGVLGSLIFVTVEFLKEPEGHIQNLSMYLFRPFLGMILALAIYVMLKSGQFTFIEDSNQNLSPFLVSFLGIISGMLAEQAYRRLAVTGGAVLNGRGAELNGRGASRNGRRAEDTALDSQKRA